MLDIDAIGIERVRRGVTRATSLRTFLTSTHPTNTFLDPVRFFVAVTGPIGSLIALFLAMHPPQFLADLPRFIFVTIMALLGGLFGMLLPFGILGSLYSLAMFLSYLDKRAERRTAGIIGFSILAIGLSLQFAGTVLDALHKL